MLPGQKPLLLLIIFLASAWIGNVSFGQSDGDEVKIGTWREVESKVLGEKRKIIVSKPADYDTTEDRYAVLYLLDGDAHFHHTSGLIKFMEANQDIPGIIVVAVPNTDRTRDLTPKPAETDAASPTAGGAENFINFFRDELIPFVDQNYRTRPYRILIGHSYGGLFTVHTLVHHSELFNAYVAISPSFEWDNQKLVGQAQTFFKESNELPRTLYMTMGNEGGQLHGGLLKVAGALKERTPPGFEWDTHVMEEETHGSVPYRSTRQGLEFIFKDWSLKSPLPLYDLGGVAAIYKHFERSSAKYGVERSAPKSAFVMLVANLNSAGRLTEAREVLEHDEKKFAPPALLYSMIAKSHLDRGHKDQAKSCYQRAFEINPADVGAKKALSELGVDMNDESQKVVVPKETLEEYVGSYKHPAVTDFAIEVTLQDGTLFGQGPGRPKTELTPVSETTFVEPRGIYKFIFERGDNKEVKQMTLLHTIDGTKIVCPRQSKEKTGDK